MARDLTRRCAQAWPQLDIRAKVREMGRAVFAGRAITVQHPDWSQEIRLARVPQRLGGERVYFCCPHCERRAAILYLGTRRMLCRRCLGLSYWSEALSPRNRRTHRIVMLRERLGQPPGRGVLPNLPAKPKWMRWPTYERLVAEIEALEHEHWHAPISARLQRELDKLQAGP